MSYQLRYAFGAAPGITLAASLTNDSGTVLGPATVVHSFEKSGNYGVTVQHADATTGFLLFTISGAGTPVALFAVNPQEAENLDIKVSTLAGGSSGSGAAGPGSIAFPWTSTDVFGTTLPGTLTWVSTDVGGVHVVAGTLVSDGNGLSTFQLNHGSYYLWQQHRDYTFFPNPTPITV